MKRRQIAKKGIVAGLFALLTLGQICSGADCVTAFAANTADVVMGTAQIQEAEVTSTPEQKTVATLTFNGNGGTFPSHGGGSKVVRNFTQEELDQSKNIVLRETFPIPVRKGYEMKYWTKENGNLVTARMAVNAGDNLTITAQWDRVNYMIKYNANGGEIISNSKLISKYNVDTETIQLPIAQKKGHHFGGWYTTKNFRGQAITSIPKGSAGNVNLYAKWISAAPGKIEFEQISTKSKKLTVKLKKNAGVKGYQIVVSTSKKFSKGSTVTYNMATNTKLEIPQAGKGTYYMKARGYAYDGLGKLCYGKYSAIQKAVMKSSVKEYKATSTSAKITSAKAVNEHTVTIKATIKKQVKSSDDFYYLVKVNPSDNTAVSSLEKVFKGNKVTFNLDTEDKVNVVSKFAIAIKQNGKYKVISKPTYISNPEKVAFNQMAYFQPASKKGIHGASDVNLGAKHTMCNININDLITTKGKGNAYKYNGKTYYFTETQQGYVKECNENGISVTVMIYMPWNDKNSYLIHPSARTKGYYYYALNTVDEKARETLEAAFCYLGESFGKKDCYVSNWVLGNEVNSQKMWNHAGNLSLNDYSKSYAQLFQMLSYGVKSSYANARIFIPLDNAWAIPVSVMGWNGKTFLASFDKALEKESPKTKWNLAYHAYSYPLTSSAYGSNPYVTKSSNSPYVSMKNIEVLTNYIKKKYGSKTRIILSEQGYTADLGEDVQAASIAYGYYKTEFNSMIDAFIIRSQYDNDEEAAQGLSMGLSNGSRKHRQAYTVFKYMDTPKAEKYTKKYLKTIGAKSWKSIIPGYNVSKLKKMKSK